MKLRQCVFVCKDLESSAEELCATLGIEIAYRDPGVGKWGLANVVCPTGHDFLEIVSPIEPGTSAGRYLERRKGDGGYMVILQVPDAVTERERITALGIRAVEKKDMAEYKYTHFHPADTAGVLLSIDQTVAPSGVDPALWWPMVLNGGEDYRLLFCADELPLDVQSRLRVHRIGEVRTGSKVMIRHWNKSENTEFVAPAPDGSFQHFG